MLIKKLENIKSLCLFQTTKTGLDVNQKSWKILKVHVYFKQLKPINQIHHYTRRITPEASNEFAVPSISTS